MKIWGGRREQGPRRWLKQGGARKKVHLTGARSNARLLHSRELNRAQARSERPSVVKPLCQSQNDVEKKKKNLFVTDGRVAGVSSGLPEIHFDDDAITGAGDLPGPSIVMITRTLLLPLMFMCSEIISSACLVFLDGVVDDETLASRKPSTDVSPTVLPVIVFHPPLLHTDTAF